MSLLHVYFTLRNQQAFQRLLDRDRSGVGLQTAHSSTSAGKSWTRKHIASALEVNAFDHLGRTVLQLACASPEPASLEYARMLLAHPAINVNLPDRENHWTALHRALYAGNIEAAILLLKRGDIDTSVKDLEGYTAFDLYSSTVRSANPTSLDDGYADLLTWGANRNAALGLGDSNDRVHPDHVVILKKDAPLPAHLPIEERFRPVKVRDVRMSKLHTVILTDEPRDNVRLCGFGSGGRLGPFSHTQYTPTSLALSAHTIVSVALGQDHTLALTSAGEVISWGLNRFVQLGYVVESGQGGSADESIQTTPRKISHLKREVIRGVAACKTASACWSDDDVWTWGTNGGQLGYSKTASPIQILPRKASIITQPIRGIAMSETAMVCLFVTGEVICVGNGFVSKISFPPHAFPSNISAYRPPQAVRGPAITKLACCDDLFAALSSIGEVFTFSLPTPNDGGGSASGVHVGGSRAQVKPQRAWALRRQFSSVRDVDVGGDGALIICTQSGHVFVRSRNLKGNTTSSGAKAFRFNYISHVQRAVAVCANSTGAFGALRVDYRPPPIVVTGRHFSADVAAIAPYVAEGAVQNVQIPLDASTSADEDLEDSSVLDDIGEMAKLVHLLCHPPNPLETLAQHGADLAVRVGSEFEVPAHRVVLAARCEPLRGVLCGDGILVDNASGTTVTFAAQPVNAPLTTPVLYFTGITPFSMLILLHYLYADEVLAVWDRRIGSLFEAQLSILGVLVTQVKTDLTTLARLLCLPHLMSALQSVGKRVAKPSASGDFQWLFEQAQLSGALRRDVHRDPLAPDVALHFADKTVYAHSAVLRARSAFFTAFFSDPDWTVQRQDDTGVVDVNLRHHTWQVMQFVLAFICFGEETMFDVLDFVGNIDELIEFMFLVISAANELLLTRLVLLCSRVILRYLSVYNASYLLTDAIHFHAVDLADRIQGYMAANMEMLLESRILDDFDARVVRTLAEHIRTVQSAQSPVSRSNQLGRAALERHKDWLALQDIPVPIVPSQKLGSGKNSPKMSPSGSAKKTVGRPLRLYSPTTSPVLRPSLPLVHPPQPLGDEIFAMDDADEEMVLKPDSVRGNVEALVLPLPAAAGPARAGWRKNPATPRTDLKAIMAEAEGGKRAMHARPAHHPGPGLSTSARWENGEGTGTSPGTGGTPPTNVRAGSSRQPGLTPEHWRPDAPPTPRRVSSDVSIPTKPEPLLAPALSRTNSGTRIAQGPPVASPSPLRPIMGPTITPARQAPNASGSGGARKLSLGGAWTLPPVQPIVSPTVPTSSTPVSFAEIQRSQATQGPTPKDKRSLRAIQEEEQARQQESAFLKWWAAEEERVRLEMAGPSVETQEASSQQSKGKGGRPRPRKMNKAEARPQRVESRGQQKSGRD